MSKDLLISVPYESFSEKGIEGLVEWYKTLGIEDEEGKIDVRRIHVNPDTFGKITDELVKFHGENVIFDINMWLLNSGPSGYHKDVLIDKCRIGDKIL